MDVMIIIAIAAMLLSALLIYGYCSNYFLRSETYEIVSSGEKEVPIKILMLADLHGNRFGTENKRLIEKIKEQRPDIICMAGDMTVKNGRGVDSCLDLCKELLALCPVYYSLGNHEIRMACYKEYISKLKEIGVFLLDNSCQEIYIKGKRISIYGLNIEEYYYHKFWQKREFSVRILRESLGDPKPGSYTVLLAHNPEYFETYCEWGANLILSGHVHGGIARLPFLGGVIDPSFRIFPKYDAGMFRSGKSIMVLSRGLGTHHIRFRFFNRPEISVILIFGTENKGTHVNGT